MAYANLIGASPVGPSVYITGLSLLKNCPVSSLARVAFFCGRKGGLLLSHVLQEIPSGDSASSYVEACTEIHDIAEICNRHGCKNHKNSEISVLFTRCGSLIQDLVVLPCLLSAVFVLLVEDENFEGPTEQDIFKLRDVARFLNVQAEKNGWNADKPQSQQKIFGCLHVVFPSKKNFDLGPERVDYATRFLLQVYSKLGPSARCFKAVRVQFVPHASLYTTGQSYRTTPIEERRCLSRFVDAIAMDLLSSDEALGLPGDVSHGPFLAALFKALESQLSREAGKTVSIHMSDAHRAAWDVECKRCFEVIKAEMIAAMDRTILPMPPGDLESQLHDQKTTALGRFSVETRGAPHEVRDGYSNDIRTTAEERFRTFTQGNDALITTIAEETAQQVADSCRAAIDAVPVPIPRWQIGETCKKAVGDVVLQCTRLQGIFGDAGVRQRLMKLLEPVREELTARMSERNDTSTRAVTDAMTALHDVGIENINSYVNRIDGALQSMTSLDNALAQCYQLQEAQLKEYIDQNPSVMELRSTGLWLIKKLDAKRAEALVIAKATNAAAWSRRIASMLSDEVDSLVTQLDIPPEAALDLHPQTISVSAGAPSAPDANNSHSAAASGTSSPAGSRPTSANSSNKGADGKRQAVKKSMSFPVTEAVAPSEWPAPLQASYAALVRGIPRDILTKHTASEIRQIYNRLATRVSHPDRPKGPARPHPPPLPLHQVIHPQSAVLPVPQHFALAHPPSDAAAPVSDAAPAAATHPSTRATNGRPMASGAQAPPRFLPRSNTISTPTASSAARNATTASSFRRASDAVAAVRPASQIGLRPPDRPASRAKDAPTQHSRPGSASRPSSAARTGQLPPGSSSTAITQLGRRPSLTQQVSSGASVAAGGSFRARSTSPSVNRAVWPPQNGRPSSAQWKQGRSMSDAGRRPSNIPAVPQQRKLSLVEKMRGAVSALNGPDHIADLQAENAASSRPAEPVP